MKIKSSITRLLVGSLLASGQLAPGKLSAQNADADPKPNIIFFLSDDHRSDGLGAAGHPVLQTPILDTLAEQGVRFENAFVTTSICMASRASIFTGVTERTHGNTFGKPPVPASIAQSSYPVLLRDAGYRTGFIGKYGVHTRQFNPAREFDFFKPVNRTPYFHTMPNGSQRHETDLCADHAIAFLQSQPKDQPFALSVSFNAPHAEDRDRRPGIGHFPWPPSTDGMYEDVQIPAPRLSDPAIFETMPEFLRNSMNRERYHWRWDSPTGPLPRAKLHAPSLWQNPGRLANRLLLRTPNGPGQHP